ncbi:FeoA family protein [Calycomorphotria hydatis]|uniref:Ferrous iron transport protein A n=1 Tax=Calycomorphotria hydatis TaxID=2528027 RepID=A0A517T4Z8_9PLAN|nr:ferrous iron transport protein A [Calycomorphotria hydatis]QDT63456.1 ferrous iron transport protein A [Calycomorphotria hydatis]
MAERTLRNLAVGDSAVIRDIQGTDSIAVRLMEMGLIAGEPIEFIRAAPLGDPLEFRVRGYTISLRSTEAERVTIE